MNEDEKKDKAYLKKIKAGGSYSDCYQKKKEYFQFGSENIDGPGNEKIIFLFFLYTHLYFPL